MTPAQLTITEGAELLACMRLSEKGMIRWYASCCRTPLANTLASARMPFVGVLRAAMVEREDGPSLDALLGPTIARAMARFAFGEPPADAHQKVPPRLMLRTLGFLARGFLGGRHAPSPFFDAQSGEPTVAPRVLTREEREALRARIAKASAEARAC